MTIMETIKGLNESERKAMSVICADCDDIEGYGFTLPSHMALALVDEFKNANVAGGYISDLLEKGLIEIDFYDETVWVEPEVYAEFC